MGKDRGRSPNDNRSDSMNKNNSAQHAAANNRSNQLNPTNTRHQGKKR